LELEPKRRFEQGCELFGSARGVRKKQHRAGIQVPKHVESAGSRQDLLTQPPGHPQLDVVFFGAGQFLAPGARQHALLFVSHLRAHEHARDPPLVDAETEQHEAVVKQPIRLEVEIERALDDAPADCLRRFVLGRQRRELTQPHRVQVLLTQVLGRLALHE
jgi:hypothetical protein